MTNDLETSTSYFREIQSIVAECFEEARRDQREPYEVLTETIDGHQWVIYTYQAKQVLHHSDNEDYTAENFGTEGILEGGTINWSLLAYGAMLGDCLDVEPPEGMDWHEVPEEAEEVTP